MKHIKNVESTVRPEARKILSDKVIIAENIREEQRQLIRYPESNEVQTMYIYDITEYSKDEYMSALDSEILDTQEALTTIYEMIMEA